METKTHTADQHGALTSNAAQRASLRVVKPVIETVGYVRDMVLESGWLFAIWIVVLAGVFGFLELVGLALQAVR